MYLIIHLIKYYRLVICISFMLKYLVASYVEDFRQSLLLEKFYLLLLPGNDRKRNSPLFHITTPMASSNLQEPEKDSYSEASRHRKLLDTEKSEENFEHVESIERVEDYPHGTRLTIIVISLMLSTFLVALDNVSINTHTSLKPH
jgi:hypothetical protein